MSANDTSTTHMNSAITIRRVDLTDADLGAVARLAERDSRERALDGPVVGIEVEGTLLAATSLATGDTVADPFSRTAELRAMLELRVAQIRRRDGHARHGLRHRLRGSRPAVGGAPAGGILTLPRWG